MKVSRTFSIDIEDLTEIQTRIDDGKISNLNEFVQNAVKNELKVNKYVKSQWKAFRYIYYI